MSRRAAVFLVAEASVNLYKTLEKSAFSALINSISM